MKNLSKRVKAIIIGAMALVCIAAAVVVGNAYKEVKHEEAMISLVRDGSFNDYNGNIGNHMEDYFRDEPVWTVEETDKGTYVNVEGTGLYYGNESDLKIQFYIHKDNENWNSNKLWINGEEAENWELNDLIYEIMQ